MVWMQKILYLYKNYVLKWNKCIYMVSNVKKIIYVVSNGIKKYIWFWTKK